MQVQLVKDILKIYWVRTKYFVTIKKNSNWIIKNFKLIHSLKNLDFLDFIIISTPTNTHLKYAYKLLNYNKPILIEKPLTHKFNQIECFIKECKRNNEKIFHFIKYALSHRTQNNNGEC